MTPRQTDNKQIKNPIFTIDYSIIFLISNLLFSYVPANRSVELDIYMPVMSPSHKIEVNCLSHCLLSTYQYALAKMNIYNKQTRF